MNNQEKKGFLSFTAGTNDKGERVALHVEGYVNKNRNFRPTGEKKALLRLSVSIGRNPWMLLGDDAVTAQADNPNCNADKPFVTVFVSGKQAEELNETLPEKAKVVFSGKVQQDDYTGKDGNQSSSVTVFADNLLVLPCQALPEGSKPGTFVSTTTNTYTNHRGEAVTERMACLVTGTVKSVSPKSETNGRSVVNFDLELAVPAAKVHALCMGDYQKDKEYGKYNVVRCAVWGPRADHMGTVLVPGNVLAVTGPTRVNKYNGNEYINMTARSISVMHWATAKGAAPANNAGAPAPAAAPNSGPAYPSGASEYSAIMDYDEDEDDLPF